ncbi:MAG: hypothetical protein K2H43_00360, partial [Clostridia bacterium]|nr:hypothetical protein [Clostridia bacterium]
YTATATGVDNTNYTLEGVTNVTTPFSIVKAEMPLSIDDTVKFVYGTPAAITLLGNSENGAATWSVVNSAEGSFSGNTFTPKKAGTVKVRVSVAATSNYLATVKEFELPVAQLVAQFTWTNTDFTYDGTTKTPTATVSNRVFNDTGTVTVSGGEVNVGDYTATAASLSNPNYCIVNEIDEDGADVNHVRQSFTINRATIVVSVTTRSAKLGTDLQLQISGNTANADVTWEIKDGDSWVTLNDLASISGSTFTPKQAGTVTVRATVAETRNTYGAEATADVVIQKGVLPLAFEDISAVYGSNFTVNVTGNLENSAVTYKIINGTGSATAVTLEGSDENNIFYANKAGTVTISATIAATQNYDAITITKEIEIAKLAVELEWSYEDAGYIYNGSEQAPRASIRNLIGSDVVSVTVKGATNAGEGLTAEAIELSGANKDNYTLTGAVNKTTSFDIAPKTVNSVVWGDTTVFTFNGKAQAPTATVPDSELCGVAGETCGVVVSGAQINVGNYVAAAASLTNSNFKLAENIAGQPFEIKMAHLEDLEHDPKDPENPDPNKPDPDDPETPEKYTLSFVKTYTKFGVNLTLSLKGNIGGGEVTYRIENIDGEVGRARLDGDTLVPLHVGKLRVIADIAETMNTYATTVTAEFTIDFGDLDLSLETLTTVYGDQLTFKLLGNLEGLTPTYRIGNPADERDGKASLSEDGLSLVPEHVGSVKVYVSLPQGAEYAAVTDLEFTITITPRPATFGWTFADKYVYNGQEQAPVAVVSNLVNGDAEFRVAVKGGVHQGTYRATVEDVILDNPNYMVVSGEATNESAEFTIVPKPIAIDWAADDYTYNGTPQVRTAFTSEELGLVAGDVCEVLVGDEYKQTNANEGKDPYPVKVTGLNNAYGDYVIAEGAENLETTFHIKKAARTDMSFTWTTTGYDTNRVLGINGNRENGDVTYAVADTSYANIEADENGVFNVFAPVKVGKVNVTATIAATENYLEGTITEEFEITISTLHISLVRNRTTYGSNMLLELDLSLIQI